MPSIGAPLERSGGFAQIGHSEDVHTGVKILKAGMAVRYVPIVVAKGLCPDQASAFLNQQYRWCTGSMSLLVDRSFHEAGELSTRQKLCFWAGFLYYIATAVNAVVAPLPAIAMLWLLPEWIEPMNSIWLVGALVLWFVILPTVMSGRWRFEVLRVQHLYSFAHLVAIWHVLTGRTKEWVATGTGGAGTPLAVTIGRAVKIFVVASQLAIWIGLWRGAQTFGLGEYWAMIGLAVLGAYIQLPLLFLRTGRRPAKAAAKTPAASKVSLVAGLGAGLVPPQPRGVRIAPALRQFRPDIQGMRAVAVLLVVLYHAHVPFVRAGYVGVDVFFVISGFLITGQLMREVERTGRVSLIGFYGARIRRLFPPAALVVVVTLVAARVWDSVFHVRTVTVDALFTLGYAMNYRLAAEGVDYQNANGPVSPLQHMWSLAVEEQFYVVWPLMILGCALVARRRARAAVIAVLLVGFALSLAASIDQTVANPTYAYFGLHTRAWELALGGLIALSATMWVKLPSLLAAPLSWAGLLAIVWSAFAFDDQTPFPGVAALVPTLGAAALIAAGCRAHRGSAEVVLALPTAQGIGRFSYGWYLWHWPMVTLIPMAVGYELAWPYLVEISLLSFWFAVLTHYLLEAPSRRSRLSMTGWLGGAAVGSTSVAAVAGVVFLSLPAFVGTGAAAKGIELSQTDPAKVQRALVKGLQVTEAPRNLNPSIENASIDQPESTKNGCHADYLVVGQGACVYGKKSAKRTMVLFGDSHAQQWLPALDRQGKRMGWKVVAWTKAACPVADIAIVNDELRREFSECYDWRDRTIRRIAALDPDIVVVSQSDSVPGEQVGNTSWADATAASLARLQAEDIPVAYVLDTPIPSRDIPDCVATHLSDVGACNLDRATATRYAGRREALDETLSRRGITAWDPAEVLCTSQSCPIVVGGLLVYRDASHLSATFSEWLAPMTEPLFVRREGKEATA